MHILRRFFIMTFLLRWEKDTTPLVLTFYTCKYTYIFTHTWIHLYVYVCKQVGKGKERGERKREAVWNCSSSSSIQSWREGEMLWGRPYSRALALRFPRSCSRYTLDGEWRGSFVLTYTFFFHNFNFFLTCDGFLMRYFIPLLCLHWYGPNCALLSNANHHDLSSRKQCSTFFLSSSVLGRKISKLFLFSSTLRLIIWNFQVFLRLGNSTKSDLSQIFSVPRENNFSSLRRNTSENFDDKISRIYVSDVFSKLYFANIDSNNLRCDLKFGVTVSVFSFLDSLRPDLPLFLILYLIVFTQRLRP